MRGTHTFPQKGIAIKQGLCPKKTSGKPIPHLILKYRRGLDDEMLAARNNYLDRYRVGYHYNGAETTYDSPTRLGEGHLHPYYESRSLLIPYKEKPTDEARGYEAPSDQTKGEAPINNQEAEGEMVVDVDEPGVGASPQGPHKYSDNYPPYAM